MKNILDLINAGRKNLATTLLGILAAVAITLQGQAADPDFDWGDWRNWAAPVAIAALGLAAKNAHHSGRGGGSNLILIGLSVVLIGGPAAAGESEPLSDVSLAEPSAEALGFQPRAWLDRGSGWAFAYTDVDDGDVGMGARLGYDLSDNFRVRLDYLYDRVNGTFVDESEVTFSVRLDLIDFETVPVFNRITPYLVAGGGSASLSELNWQYLVGGGFEAQFSNKWKLFTEFLHIRAEDGATQERNEVRAGLGIDFADINGGLLRNGEGQFRNPLRALQFWNWQGTGAGTFGLGLSFPWNEKQTDPEPQEEPEKVSSPSRLQTPEKESLSESVLEAIDDA